MPNKFLLFWGITKLCGRKQWVDDNAVQKPVIEHLSHKNHSAIFAFHNMMTELLYNLNWQSNRKGRSLKCMTAHFYVPDMWLSSMVRTIMKI